jgi:hypothetical protein
MKKIFVLVLLCIMSNTAFSQKKSNGILFDSTHTYVSMLKTKIIRFEFYQDFKKIDADSSKINQFISDVVIVQERSGWKCTTVGPSTINDRAHYINMSTDSTQVHVYLYSLSFQRTKKTTNPFPIFMSHYRWYRHMEAQKRKKESR